MCVIVGVETHVCMHARASVRVSVCVCVCVCVARREGVPTDTCNSYSRVEVMNVHSNMSLNGARGERRGTEKDVVCAVTWLPGDLGLAM